MRVSTDSPYKKYMVWKHGAATFFEERHNALLRYEADKANGDEPALFVNVQIEPAQGYAIAK